MESVQVEGSLKKKKNIMRLDSLVEQLRECAYWFIEEMANVLPMKLAKEPNKYAEYVNLLNDFKAFRNKDEHTKAIFNFLENNKDIEKYINNLHLVEMNNYSKLYNLIKHKRYIPLEDTYTNGLYNKKILEFKISYLGRMKETLLN